MEETWASVRQTSRLWSKNWWPTWTICLGSGERQKVLSCFKGFTSHTWISSDSSTADDQFLTYRKGNCQFYSCAVGLLNVKSLKFFRLTVTDVRLLLFPDMIFFGLVYMARGLALQYGDGLSNNEFWRESIYFYNRFGKVGSCCPNGLISVLIFFTLWSPCHISVEIQNRGVGEDCSRGRGLRRGFCKGLHLQQCGKRPGLSQYQ